MNRAGNAVLVGTSRRPAPRKPTSSTWMRWRGRHGGGTVLRRFPGAMFRRSTSDCGSAAEQVARWLRRHSAPQSRLPRRARRDHGWRRFSWRPKRPCRSAAGPGPSPTAWSSTTRNSSSAVGSLQQAHGGQTRTARFWICPMRRRRLPSIVTPSPDALAGYPHDYGMCQWVPDTTRNRVIRIGRRLLAWPLGANGPWEDISPVGWAYGFKGHQGFLLRAA